MQQTSLANVEPMIDRCYLEVTNICNLDCVFCPKNERTKRRLTTEQFDLLTEKLRGEVKFLYFHLMGEPMLHPQLPQFIRMAREKGFLPVLTTNGTLLSRGQEVIDAHPYKIQISLHSQEANGFANLAAYVAEVMTFAIESARQGVVVVLRLWNQGGYDNSNDQLLDLMSQHVPQPWTERYDGFRLCQNLYLEYDRMFEWPEPDTARPQVDEAFCAALKKQIGVLVDGSLVPCCLDHEGCVTLGNLFTQSLDEILHSPRAQRLLDGFSHHKAVEPLCQHCEGAGVKTSFRGKNGVAILNVKN